MGKTPFLPGSHTLAANPFNRIRWNVNEVEGKWDAAVRGLLFISTCKDLREARDKATETLGIMAKEAPKV